MIIDCPKCRARVDATEKGLVEHYNPEEEPWPYRVVVGDCPQCKCILVGLQEEWDHPDGWSYWSDALRIWPEPQRILPASLPKAVKNSIEEAERCYGAGAYDGCVVMCGRALEALCAHHGATKRTLADSLSELRERGIIDSRLYEWGDELRKMRNLGAHPSDEKVPQRDAKDLLEFVHSITDYLFILSDRFRTFIERRNIT